MSTDGTETENWPEAENPLAYSRTSESKPVVQLVTCKTQYRRKQEMESPVSQNLLRRFLGWASSYVGTMIFLQVRGLDQTPYHHELTVSSLGRVCQPCAAPLFPGCFFGSSFFPVESRPSAPPSWLQLYLLVHGIFRLLHLFLRLWRLRPPGHFMQKRRDMLWYCDAPILWDMFFFKMFFQEMFGLVINTG